jgi:hypothetical protein
MQRIGFTYDCSINAIYGPGGAGANFPYTLDIMTGQQPDAKGNVPVDNTNWWGQGAGVRPQGNPIREHKGLWVIPASRIEIDPADRTTLQAKPGFSGSIPGNDWTVTGYDYNLWNEAKADEAQSVRAYMNTVRKTLAGNRAPLHFGFNSQYYFTGTNSEYNGLTQQQRRGLFEEFVKQASQLPDVFFVTGDMVIAWMENPCSAANFRPENYLRKAVVPVPEPLKVATPTASIPTGSAVEKNTTVRLSSTTIETVIYYTIDGSTPSATSGFTAQPIVLTKDVTIRAIAYKAGVSSEIAVFEYTVYEPTYDPAAIAVINHLIDNNGLSATKDNPASWTFAAWNSAEPKQLTGLSLSDKSLQGEASFAGLTNLKQLNCNINHLTAINISGLTNLENLNCGENNLTVLDVSALTSLSNFSGSGQSANLTLNVVANGKYETSIALLHPVFGSAAVSYSGGLLTCTDNKVAGTSFNVETGNNDYKLSGTLNFTYVEAPPVITTTSLPAASVNTAYNQTLTASGTQPIAWEITAGNLPDGFSFAYSSGTISGTPTVAGTYNFTVKASNALGFATKALSIVVGGVTGIAEVAAEKIRLYPNPITNVLIIESGELRVEKVDILDVTGKTVFSSNKTEINISHLPSGTYFVKMQTASGELIKKVIKE